MLVIALVQALLFECSFLFLPLLIRFLMPLLGNLCEKICMLQKTASDQSSSVAITLHVEMMLHRSKVVMELSAFVDPASMSSVLMRFLASSPSNFLICFPELIVSPFNKLWWSASHGKCRESRCWITKRFVPKKLCYEQLQYEKGRLSIYHARMIQACNALKKTEKTYAKCIATFNCCFFWQLHGGVWVYLYKNHEIPVPMFQHLIAMLQSCSKKLLCCNLAWKNAIMQ